ncbi:9175_t:CDS:10 [Entrophospora sp. SA101]|nr:547_t:CDS:10 [Entrophospora sp. SA101]CAJ0844349.1 9175_t:CDS:10 [Entrophospora sp. SA101]
MILKNFLPFLINQQFKSKIIIKKVTKRNLLTCVQRTKPQPFPITTPNAATNSNLIIVQKRMKGGAKQVKKPTSITQKTKSYKKPKVSEAQATIDSSSIHNEKFAKNLPIVELEEMSSYEFVRHPSLMIRESSVGLIDILKKASENSSLKSRYILAGPLGSGKSALLLQAINYALCNSWAIIYIPDAIKIVDSRYPYSKALVGEEYVQPTLVSLLLSQIKKVNRIILESLSISEDTMNEFKLKNQLSLDKLLEIGIKDIHLSQKVFESFLKELSNNERFSVLLAVDVVNAFYTNSEYTDNNDKKLESNKLSLPRSIKPLEEALNISESSVWNPRSPTILQYTKDLQRFDVKMYTQKEAKGILDYYYNTMIKSDPKDSYFLKQYFLTNGNPKEFYLNCWKGFTN